MKIEDVISLYRNDPEINALTESLKSPGPNLRLEGINGSFDAIITALVFSEVKGRHLILLSNPEEASYFASDLRQLLPEREILCFPPSFPQPFRTKNPDNTNILLRAEMLSRLSNEPPEHYILVTCPDALVEMVVLRQTLRKHHLFIQTGEVLTQESLIDFLQEYHFHPTNFVFESGQFSVRGGIIDVFSYSSELPFRIEFFDNRIQSIRSFNPTDQLSLKKFTSIHLVPDIKKQESHPEHQTFFSFLSGSTGAQPLKNNPDNSTTYFIWCKEVALLVEIFQQYSNLSEPGITLADPGTLLQQINQMRVIEFGGRDGFKAPLCRHFSTRPQTQFHKDINLVAQHLLKNQQEGIRNLIFSDSAKQSQRLEGIFKEINPFLEFKIITRSLRKGFTDPKNKICFYTDHEIFDRYYSGNVPKHYSSGKAITLKELRDLKPGDFITHTDYGVGKFAGLQKTEQNGKKQEVIRLVYKDNDLLFVNIYSLHKISRFSGKEGHAPQLSKLGSPEWEKKKSAAKKKVKDIAKDLIVLYAKRKAAPGFSFTKDTYLQEELESSFMFEDTPDQISVTAAVKKDMEGKYPMDRLICGDVGFGKTEIAIRASFKAVADNKQVAILVPTTILAFQHYGAFQERLRDFPCKVEFVSRFKSPAQIKETLKELAEGKIDIIIGTHRLLSRDVKFKDLGLMVIDEEQKFGVTAKEKLKQFKINTDTLTLTATPIPRTLQFSLMGSRDLSLITTPPPNRQPIETQIHLFEEDLIKHAIDFEIQRGGQVFFVHNRIEDIKELGGLVQRLCPYVKVGIAHGKMESHDLEKVMVKFYHGEYDVLIATTLIESGLDVPNANTIIINRAHTFGLSELHQLRGRVGRSNKKAYCYLLTPLLTSLTSEAKRRLSALEEFSYLGAGFNVAMRDLDIRGAGNLLGAEQSGFISDIGFELYHQILDEAIRELKQDEFKELFTDTLPDKPAYRVDCTVESDFEALLPSEYVSDTTERMALYTELSKIKDELLLERFSGGLIDRFGPLPGAVKDLLDLVRVRWMGEKLGFEKIQLRNFELNGHFISDADAPFYKSGISESIINYIQQNPKGIRLRQEKGKLVFTVSPVLNIQSALEWLTIMDVKVREMLSGVRVGVEK